MSSGAVCSVSEARSPSSIIRISREPPEVLFLLNSKMTSSPLLRNPPIKSSRLRDSLSVLQDVEKEERQRGLRTSFPFATERSCFNEKVHVERVGVGGARPSTDGSLRFVATTYTGDSCNSAWSLSSLELSPDVFLRTVAVSLATSLPSRRFCSLSCRRPNASFKSCSASSNSRNHGSFPRAVISSKEEKN